MSGVEVIRSSALKGVPHGFLGRRGGVSQGVVAGLNVGWGSDDDRAAITENRRRAVESVLPGARLVTVHQVHSSDVVEAGDWPDDDRPHADALVTNKAGILLGILTADCAPVLYVDREAGVIGAAHSGWRGAVAGVNEATVTAMERLGARRDRIAAAIGPAIAARNYEVDHGFEERFLSLDPANERFFTEGPAGKPHFDLEAYIVARLAAAGVRKVEALGLDTYADSDRFYSFRRATHRREPDYGRQASLIGLPA
ncbi:peptidoglycan editing factor PgeF [Sphingomonas alba]|uniref:Purine nucleoside phosphorylase n=1 Tax=Sphingomonas alba TaxID=2908208 RepID=A0ABT0RLQ8_9SPHN|nr:peptidoglycan editing factor PgeF [Sphingomonas alba]MCL6683586.1 peptidoglycan editing factor PgeF [Sphingomonas alba]